MNKHEFINSMPSFEEVFTFENLMNSAKECRKGVRWKANVQKYNFDLGYNISLLQKSLIERKYKPRRFTEFEISERGKKRHIKAPAYEDRIVQRCLCDNFLVPLLTRFIIYDNSATIKNRGTEFAIKRLRTHLEKFSHERTSVGYIMMYDFKDYFNSINHEILFKMLDELIVDKSLKGLVHRFINDFGDKGLGLGSQVSQICAVYYPNRIDHYFKDQCGVKYYHRFMDDGYIIAESLDELKGYKEKLFELAKELDLVINDKKVKIVRLDHTFTFLKRKFTLTDDNHVIVRLCERSIRKMREKLKKLSRLEYEYIITAYKSWRGNAIKYKNYKAIRRLDELHDNIYYYPFLEGRYRDDEGSA